MKKNYLNELKLLLDQYNMEDSEKNDIVNDYGDMYDNWIENGMNEDEVESKLGAPNSIIGDLVEGYRKIRNVEADKRSSRGHKLIALMPFISLLLFFVGGFVFDGWVYSWMAFLLIPVVAIIVEMSQARDKHIFTALSPFAVVVGYLILGFVYNLWHPGWLIFLAIPVIAIVTELKSMGFLPFLTSISPFAAIVAFVVLLETEAFTPAWLVFLIIPIIGVLNEKNKLKVLIWEILIIGGALGHMYLLTLDIAYGFTLLSFLPIVIYGVIEGDIQITGMQKEYKGLLVFIIIAYIALGLFVPNMWGYAWLLFLIIPVYAIIKETNGNARVISLTPFIALFIFFTLGWFGGWWAFSWIAFLLIPIVAIIKEA